MDTLPAKNLFRITLDLNGKRRTLNARRVKETENLMGFVPVNADGQTLEKPKGKNGDGVPIVETELILVSPKEIRKIQPLVWNKHYGALEVCR